MRYLLLAAALLAASPASPAAAAAPAHAKPSSLSALLKRVSAYLSAPAVKSSRRRAAVAAVRGGIPTDQGEDLDLRLLDRAQVLREALKREDASASDEGALRPIYEALSASQYVQALSIIAAPEARGEASGALETWASEPREPELPAEVVALLTGPAAGIDDQALVKAGWGGYVRSLTVAPAAARAAAAGWSSSEDASRLDETLKGLSDSWLVKKLAPEQEAKAHVLAGAVYAALARADLKGRAPAADDASSAPLAAEDDGPAPAEATAAFEPKTIYQKASKSVVLIICAAPSGTGELGTGSVVDAARRRILTNAHVVIQDSTRKPWSRVNVYFKPAKVTGDTRRDLVAPATAKVLFWDSALDLALLEIDRLPAGVPAIALGHPDSVSIGDRVAAIGHPEQGGLWTLTTGVISTVLADLGGVKGKDAFQTDTSINRGNSGGPLLDASGRLVGVNTSMSRKAADGLAITSVNFSVQAAVAKRWMAGRGEKVAYGGAGAVVIPAAASVDVPSPAPAPARPKQVTITEGKPFSRDALIEAEIAKMEDLGDEMREEIELRRKP